MPRNKAHASPMIPPKCGRHPLWAHASGTQQFHPSSSVPERPVPDHVPTPLGPSQRRILSVTRSTSPQPRPLTQSIRARASVVVSPPGLAPARVGPHGMIRSRIFFYLIRGNQSIKSDKQRGPHTRREWLCRLSRYFLGLERGALGVRGGSTSTSVPGLILAASTS